MFFLTLASDDFGDVFGGGHGNALGHILAAPGLEVFEGAAGAVARRDGGAHVAGVGAGAGDAEGMDEGIVRVEMRGGRHVAGGRVEVRRGRLLTLEEGQLQGQLHRARVGAVV